MLKAGTFNDRTVIITGGGTGLGRSMALCLSDLGAKIVICGRRLDVLEAAAAELKQRNGTEVLAQRCDVRNTEEVDALVAAAYERFGAVHALVNNAAGNFICPTERLSYNAVHSVVDIVLYGTLHCTLAFGKRWIAEGSQATILNIVATYASSGSGFVVPSAVAKAGVLALTQSLASEWGKYGIRSNAIAPGPFPTEGAWSRLMPAALKELGDPADRIPLGRTGEHEELANLAAYLLSDYSSFINGDCIRIDGGEWVRAAGEFNYLEAVTPEQWDEIQQAMKPRRQSS
ncbi:MAG TPA: SDR family oxidoreductase [Pirellulales bacterium]|nr:SDR family oxidoreductase [Pirellulales bacterium]